MITIYRCIVLISQQLGRASCIVLVKLPGAVAKAPIQQPAKSSDSMLHVGRAHRRKGHTLGSNRKTGAAAARAAASLAAADADLGLAVLPAGTGGVAGAGWLLSSQSTCKSNLPQLVMCSRVQCSGWPPSLHHPHKVFVGLQLTVHLQKLSCTVHNGRVHCDAMLRHASSSRFRQDSALSCFIARQLSACISARFAETSNMCYACSCRLSWLMKLRAYHL